MRIRVNDDTLAECVVDVKKDISKKQEFVVKALCFLILMTTNDEGDPHKFNQFMSIIREAIKQSEDLYKEEEESYNESDTFDEF